MLKIFMISAILISTCHASGGTGNDKWKRTDNVLKDYCTIYDNLAIFVEDGSNKQKRAFSIIISGLLKYMASGGDTSVSVDTSKPADVIAGDIISVMDLTSSVLDPAINLVKEACPPEASDKECSKSLAEGQKEQMKECDDFSNHMQFLDDTEELFGTKEYDNLICNMVKVSKKSDDDQALAFLDELKSGKKHKQAVSGLVEWFEKYSKRSYTCNLPPIGDGSTDSGSSNENNKTDDKGSTDKKDKPKKLDKAELEKMLETEMKKLHHHKSHGKHSSH